MWLCFFGIMSFGSRLNPSILGSILNSRMVLFICSASAEL